MAEISFNKIIDEDTLMKRVAAMGQELTAALKDEKEPPILVCVLKGSFIFYADLIRHLDLDVRTDFLGCASYGNSTSSSGEVKLTLDLTHSIQGKTVVIVEDIVDTGLTMNYLLQNLKARNPKRILTASLLFKPESMKTDYKPDFVGFKIGREFVIGYGLDYQGHYRNLPYIAQVNSLQ